MPRLLVPSDPTTSNQCDTIFDIPSTLEPNKNQTQSFPEKLYTILLEKRNRKAIRWNQSGTQFSIKNRHKLCKEVLPRHFSCKVGFKYTSFTRKLQRWNFRRSSSGMDKCIFSHPMFQRDKPILCLQMKCRSNAKQGKALSNTNNEAISRLTSNIYPRSTAVETDESDSQVSSVCDEMEMAPSFVDVYEKDRISRDSVLAMLRRDASILYKYRNPVRQVYPPPVICDSSQNVATQAIIDAAVIAMKRCDDAILQRNQLLYERILKRASCHNDCITKGD